MIVWIRVPGYPIAYLFDVKTNRCWHFGPTGDEW